MCYLPVLVIPDTKNFRLNVQPGCNNSVYMVKVSEVNWKINAENVKSSFPCLSFVSMLIKVYSCRKKRKDHKTDGSMVSIGDFTDMHECPY